MHYMAPVETSTFHWFAQPCRDAFAVLQRRLGFSPPSMQPQRAGCRLEFERSDVVVAVTYWLGLPPVVEIVHPNAEMRSRFEVPYLPPRALPRAVASLHARLRLAPPCFAQSDEALTEQLVTSRERPGLARALRLHLRVLAADLLRRHRGKLAPEREANQRASMPPSETETKLRCPASSVSVRSRTGSPSASTRMV
jgi:hypothetical protein